MIELIGLMNSVMIFLSQMVLLKIVDLFNSSDTSIRSTMSSPP